MTDRKLLKIKKEALQSFEQNFAEAVRLYNSLLQNLKQAGITVTDWQQLDLMLDEYSENEIIKKFMRIASWKRNAIKPELLTIEDNELVINEAAYQQYIQDEFYIFESDRIVIDQKLASEQLVRALNDAVPHYPEVRFLDLPLYFAYDSIKNEYYLRAEYFKPTMSNRGPQRFSTTKI